MSACAGDTVRPKRRSASSVRQDVRAVLYSVSGYTTFPLLPYLRAGRDEAVVGT